MSKVIDLRTFKKKDEFVFETSRKIRNLLEEAFADSEICFDTVETLIASEVEDLIT